MLKAEEQMDLVVLACAAVGVLFSEIPGKMSRHLREIVESRKPEVSVDEQTIAMQIEQRLRAEMEEELARELGELEQNYKRKKETPARPKPRLSMGKVTDVRELRSGIVFKSSVDVKQGGIASEERVDDGSYVAKYELELKVPKAAVSLEELSTINPKLPEILPSLGELLESGEVSPWFGILYENKVDRVRRHAAIPRRVHRTLRLEMVRRPRKATTRSLHSLDLHRR